VKAGDLVKIVQGGELVSPWLGKRGIVVDKYDHLKSTKPGWFAVMIVGKLLMFHRDYLSVVNESR